MDQLTRFRTDRHVRMTRFGAKPDQIAGLKTGIAQVAKDARAAGAVRFDLFSNPDNSAEFTLYEAFPDEAQFKSFRASPAGVHTAGLIDNAATGTPDPVTWRHIMFGDVVGLPPAPGNLIIMARFRVRGEFFDEYVEAARENRQGMIDAQRISYFDLNRGIEDPLEVCICARWKDRPSWQAHQALVDYAAQQKRMDGPMQRAFWIGEV